MKKVLVTGGTVFVSRYIAEYYVTYCATSNRLCENL